MRKIRFILIYWVFFLLITVPHTTLAVGPGEIGIKQPGAGVQIAGRSATDLLSTVLRNTITLIFSAASIAVVLIFLWGTVDWILSGGDKEKIAGARRKMVNSLIGLLLLSLSFVILQVVGQITSFNLLGDMPLPKFGESGQQP